MNTLKVIVIADSSSEIGTGHISRSRYLVNQLLSLKIKVIFITNNKIEKNYFRNTSNLKIISNIQNLEKKYEVLNYLLNYKKYIIHNIIYDTNFTLLNPPKQILNKTNFIQITDRFQKSKNIKILNQNLYDLYLKSSKHSLGSRFSFIDNNFSQYKINKNKIKTICISFGTVDSKRLTYSLVRLILTNNEFNKFNFIIIIGEFNKEYKIIKNLLKDKKNFKIFYKYKNISNILKKCELAFGNCGVSNLERMILGIPTILISSNNLQKKISIDLNNNNISKFLGNYTIRFDNTLALKILKIIEDKKEIDVLKNNCLIYSDKLGIKRFIYKNILKIDLKKLRLKNAQNSDVYQYYRWFNEPIALKNSIINEKIDIKSHQNWFLKRIKKKFMFILHIDNFSLGQIRFDCINLKKKQFIIDYSIDFDFRGLGLGKKIILLGVNEIYKSLNSFTLIANVLNHNISSKKVFFGLGFKNQYIKKNNLVIFTKLYEKN